MLTLRRLYGLSVLITSRTLNLYIEARAGQQFAWTERIDSARARDSGIYKPYFFLARSSISREAAVVSLPSWLPSYSCFSLSASIWA